MGEPVGSDCTDSGEGRYTCTLTVEAGGYNDNVVLLRKEGMMFSYGLGYSYETINSERFKLYRMLMLNLKDKIKKDKESRIMRRRQKLVKNNKKKANLLLKLSKKISKSKK